MDLENISDYGDMTGQSQVWLGFYFHSDASIVYAEGAYVDDILLRKCVGGGCAAATFNVSEPDRFGWYTFPAVKALEQP